MGKAAEAFMRWLRGTKASIPRSNKTALCTAKNLAVAVYTRHQRAQQLRESKHEHEQGSDADAEMDDDDEEEDDDDDDDEEDEDEDEDEEMESEGGSDEEEM